MEEGLIKKLMSSIKCGSCGQRYETHNIDVLEHREDVWFLRVSCSSCYTQCLIAAIIKEARVAETAEPELDKIINVDVVGVDDVLDMHNFLKDFDGDFAHLLGQG